VISSVFIESALRSVLLALAVWTALRLFAVRNVLAQKVAWGLVLASALTMPALLRMTEHWSVLPASVRVIIPADPETLLEELQARIQAKTPSQSAPASASPAASPAETDIPDQKSSLAPPPQARLHREAKTQPAAQNIVADRYPAPSISQSSLNTADTPLPAPVPAWRKLSLLQLAGLLYLAVAAILCLRLLFGSLAALHVWRSATPLQLDPSPLTNGLRLRVSRSISSPVTIGSAVVLPADYRSWDAEKLRIVLAHERSHIRQGDFYLQLLAGVYAAAVWFSPLGWWLKRKLSDLAEAISDRAGLEEAADRASYAQILLEFAAAPRPTLIGVAMARHGSLSRRIERLLNDVSFRQAFAGTRRALAAVIVVPVALFATTALLRVEAAGQQPPPTPPAPPAPMATAAPQSPAVPPVPEEGISTPEQISDELAPPAMPQTPEKPAAPAPPEKCPPHGVMALPAPAAPAAPALAIPPAHAPAVMILPGKSSITALTMIPRHSIAAPVVVIPRIAYAPSHATLALLAPAPVAYGEGRGYGIGQSTSTSTESGTVIASHNGNKSGYHYSYSSHGDSYAIVKGDGSMSFNGNIHSSELDKARKLASGKDFIWFERNGKQYIIDDPATLAQIESMYKPMEELGRLQEELGKKQEALGKQQEELGKKQEAASVPTPDMSREIAQIEESMAKLKAAQGKNMTQEQFADLQEKLGELQGKLGDIQGEIGEKQGEFGNQMGALGEKMGALGEQMGELGEQQGKIAEQADQKIRSIIDQSMKNGKAHPVQ
jgi:beta-lactamase regulating signal transducer with metallopeptidase domain